MEILVLEYRDNEYDEDLLSYLRNRVFHLTTHKSYDLIQKDGAIFTNNRGDRYPVNSGRRKCYGNCHGLVCLFDLRGKHKTEIDDGLLRYNFLRPPGTHFEVGSEQFIERRMVYLLVSPSAYPSLITNDKGPNIFNDPSACNFHIPKVECWFPKTLPLTSIEKLLSVKVIPKNLSVP